MNNIEREIETHLPAAIEGNRQAFGTLVTVTQAMVTSLALAVVRDVHHSEDIAQEAYIKVWRRLHCLRNTRSFLPWLRQITRNLARDHIRRGLVRPGDAARGSSESLETEPSAPRHASSEQRALRDEKDRIIREGLESLSAESREVLTLFYREGQSTRQVADLLGLSDAAVRKRLERGRRGLREEVAQRLDGALRCTAPGMAFTAAVGATMAAASPPAAAAATFGLGAKGGINLIASASMGALIGVTGGIAGVVLGLRRWIATSTDPRERAGLLRIRRLGVASVVLAAMGFGLSTQWPGWWPPALVFTLFLAALGWQQMVMLPRVLAPRLVRQREIDPGAARRQLRQKRLAWMGMLIGTLSGGAGLIAGLVLSGRLPFMG